MKTLLLIVLLGAIPLSAQNSKLDAFAKSIKQADNLKYGEATKTLLDIYNSYSDDYLVNLRLGWLYYVTNDYKTSEKYYHRAITISSNSHEAFFGLTLPLSKEKKWDTIINIYKSILDNDSHNYTANLRLGQIYFNNKNYLNAKALFEIIQNDSPSDYYANLYLGWTYYYLGNGSMANSYFTNALISVPADTSASKGFELTK